MKIQKQTPRQTLAHTCDTADPIRPPEGECARCDDIRANARAIRTGERHAKAEREYDQANQRAQQLRMKMRALP